MRRRRGLILALLVMAASAAAAFVVLVLASSVPADRDPGMRTASAVEGFPPGVRCLDGDLEPLRASARVPALGCAVLRDGRLAALGVSGTRRAGGDAAVRWDDRFHIGSNTKAMTATLIAMLIEDGRLQWESTLAQLFPELSADMRPEYASVTVEMLLHHESGLPEDGDDRELFRQLRRLRGSAQEQRLAAVRLALSRVPACTPGTRNIYANLNFTILGCIAERVTGSSWEDQLRQRLFAPLGMTSAGFGAPSTPGALDQPWGHALRGWLQRLYWNERSPVPPAGAPAGDVSVSLPDWARFAKLHLDAEHGTCRLLTCASFRRLHAVHPTGSAYACGWGVTRDAESGRMLQHVGSDGWWFAVAVISPDLDEAILVATNAGGERGQQACDAGIIAMRALRSKRRVTSPRRPSRLRNEDCGCARERSGPWLFRWSGSAATTSAGDSTSARAVR